MNNVNLETGVRFGIIAANSLDPDLVMELTSVASEQYRENLKDFKDAIRKACEEQGFWPCNTNSMLHYAEDVFNGDYEDDGEQTHTIDYDGVKGKTTWLGGALHVFIFESPHIRHHALCSPCVPNCGNLDQDGDFPCYDVPDDWRINND